MEATDLAAAYDTVSTFVIAMVGVVFLLLGAFFDFKSTWISILCMVFGLVLLLALTPIFL